METINVINVGGVDKEIEDTVARDSNTTQSSQIQTLTNNLATTNNNLASEASARASADTLINTRIDEIVAPTGEAPNPAEIVDARIGVDGTVHDSLGLAIRTQVKDIVSMIKQCNSYDYLCTANIYNRSATSNGVTFTYDDEGNCHITGSMVSEGASTYSTAFNGMSPAKLPDGMVPGKSYYVVIDGGDKAYVSIVSNNNGTLLNSSDTNGSKIFKIDLSENDTGMRVRYFVSSYGVELNETIHVRIVDALPNSIISSSLLLDRATERIYSGDDLNNYTIPGSYRIQSASEASQIANVPYNIAGRLVVMKNTAYSNPTQFYLTGGSLSSGVYHMYVRYKTPDGWTTWDAIAYSSDVKELKASTIGVLPPNESLNSNDDLNTYLTPGQWSVPSQAVSKSLRNKPYNFAQTGTFLVLNTHNDNHVYQIILGSGTTSIWARHIRIDAEDYNEWVSLTNSNNSSELNIHDPYFENQLYIDAFSDLLNMSVGGTSTHSQTVDGLRVISSEVMYSLWDALQAKYPQYIEPGEVIGYSLDTEGQNYHAVKVYHVHPRKTYFEYGSTHNIDYDDIPTLVITAGTHGGEGSPVWNIFAMIYRALVLGEHEEILNEMQYRIIPVLDCWSYDHKVRYLAAAYNSDMSVKEEALDPITGEISDAYDPNRQCVCSDMSNPSYETLITPSYATEAKALMDYIESLNLGSSDGYMDLHNCSNSLGYCTSVSLAHRRLFNAMMDELAKDWLREATWANGDPVDYYSTNTANHFELSGKILGRESTAKTFAWFYGTAYQLYISSLLEVQQSDSKSSFAFAKGMDMTSRWLKTVTRKIKALT